MDGLADWGLSSSATWEHIGLALAVVAAGYVLGRVVRSALRGVAERVHPKRRLGVLRTLPIARLVIGVAAFACAVPLLMEPSFQNVTELVASLVLIMAFAFKDYGSSLIAGLVTIVENTYQPGDWVEIDGTYGEVKHINLRATHLVTAEDTEVIIPHSRLWSASVHNASSGQRGLLCVTSFYLDADHDAAAASEQLQGVAESCPHRAPDTDVVVIVAEQPWGTHYKVKAYVRDSSEQFRMISDITIRGKAVLRLLGARFAQAPYAVAA